MLAPRIILFMIAAPIIDLAAICVVLVVELLVSRGIVLLTLGLRRP